MMEKVKFKIIALWLLLSIMLNVFLPYGFSVKYPIVSGDVVPGVFNMIKSACAPIDTIGDMVNKMLEMENMPVTLAETSSPVKKDNKESKSADNNVLFVPQQSMMHKNFKDMKKSPELAGIKVSAEYFKSGTFDNATRMPPDKTVNIFLLLLLLAYISILYRDVWVNKLNNNIFKTCGVL